MIIDLRSDTVTFPDDGMLRAMMQAKVGDDVFGEDPTVNELQHMGAGYFGFEDALFVPSGTMANQIAIKLHTEPGDEILCEENSHIYHYETGGASFNSGVQIKPIRGQDGLLSAELLEPFVLPNYDWYPRTRLVCLENTANRAGGTFYAQDQIRGITDFCERKKLRLHIDGARIWNALAETSENPKHYGTLCHTMSVCLSKGLGCPVGSLLLGSADDIKKARRIRKVLGGGMRQAGYLAAAGIYAIRHNLNKIKEDHRRAKELYEFLKKKVEIKEIKIPRTNIIIFKLADPARCEKFMMELRQKGILVSAMAQDTLRMVTHLNFSDHHLDYLKKMI
ncbi:MAG: aminotransferase class I/II-fold pyridoxal phosphate-dependent enzyme [Bacteroidia bacterium]|nr:aminotransferase class I/II-fold pyridoxal phosphate-dependent enzyme [Bacteroidia bacterium]